MGCPDCGETDEEVDETSEALDSFVETENADGMPFSVFGAPMTHDGTLPISNVIYIRRIADITPEGWAHLFMIRRPDWVIIPLESENHGNHVSEGRAN